MHEIYTSFLQTVKRLTDDWVYVSYPDLAYADIDQLDELECDGLYNCLLEHIGIPENKLSTHFKGITNCTDIYVLFCAHVTRKNLHHFAALAIAVIIDYDAVVLLRNCTLDSHCGKIGQGEYSTHFLRSLTDYLVILIQNPCYNQFVLENALQNVDASETTNNCTIAISGVEDDSPTSESYDSQSEKRNLAWLLTLIGVTAAACAGYVWKVAKGKCMPHYWFPDTDNHQVMLELFGTAGSYQFWGFCLMKTKEAPKSYVRYSRRDYSRYDRTCSDIGNLDETLTRLPLFYDFLLTFASLLSSESFHCEFAKLALRMRWIFLQEVLWLITQPVKWSFFISKTPHSELTSLERRLYRLYDRESYNALIALCLVHIDFRHFMHSKNHWIIKELECEFSTNGSEV